MICTECNVRWKAERQKGEKAGGQNMDKIQYRSKGGARKVDGSVHTDYFWTVFSVTPRGARVEGRRVVGAPVSGVQQGSHWPEGGGRGGRALLRFVRY